ncbi:putative leucine-rich repeat-containing protein DDB_G0290503 [Clytia hemisphaerica]|uniref:putative leucine-rich repeat-containing protein DDB_G0290503 n=1 Tax=Clytia hemisphaerica TaxID=252671 RepID=UPI0034D7BA02
MDNYELEEETMASLQRSMISEEFSQTYQDMENFLADYPRRILTKPHNDPERTLHRKYVELSALVRRLDERNQQLSLHSQKMIDKLKEMKEYYKPSEDRIKELGNKNMDLNQTIRKLDQRIKDMQKEFSEKNDKITNLQLLLERKERKLKKIRSKDSSAVNADDFETAQRQISDQLQIIAELRHQNLEKDRRVNNLKKKLIEKCSMDPETLECEDSNKKDEESGEQEKIKLLTKENMELQRLYHLLQRQTEEKETDPQRNAMALRDMQSDIESLHSINEDLVKQVEDQKDNMSHLTDDNNFLKDELEKVEEENKDMRDKLINSEEEIFKKTLQLKSLTEELKVTFDQNDLLELKLSHLTTTQLMGDKVKEMENEVETDEVKNFAGNLAVDEDPEDTIQIKFNLRQLVLKKGEVLSKEERKVINEADNFIGKLSKELSISKCNNVIMLSRIRELEEKFNVSHQNLLEQHQELEVLRKDKLKREEMDLLFVNEEKIILDKSVDETPSFVELNKGIESAKKRIEELEQAKKALEEKLLREQSKLSQSEDEIQLLRLEAGKFREADLQLTMLQKSNMKILKEFKRREDESALVVSTPQVEVLTEDLMNELSQLQTENENLNKEMGVIHSQSSQAVDMVNEAKSVLEKCETATQTPKILLIPISERAATVEQSNQTEPSIDFESEGNDRIGENNNKEAVTEEDFEYTELQDVECLPIDFDQFFNDVLSTKDNEPQIVEEILNETEASNLMAEPPNMLDEIPPQDDNEFILSVMKEYEKSGASGGEPHNQSVIYKPLPPPTIALLRDTGTGTADGVSCQTSFDMYLNKTVSTEPALDSDAPLSTIPSDRSEEPPKRTEDPNIPSYESYLYHERRASSSADSNITPRSTGVTPLSVDSFGITPREKRDTPIQARSFSSASKSSRTPYSSTPSLRSPSKTAYTFNSKYSSMSHDSLSKTASRNEDTKDIKDILNIVDIKQMLDSSIGKDSFSTNEMKKESFSTSLTVNEMKNSSASIAINSQQSKEHEKVDDVQSSRFENDTFLTELLSESKKIKALAEQIFTSANIDKYQSMEELSQHEEILKPTRSQSVDNISSETPAKFNKMGVSYNPAEVKPPLRECNCQCDICKSKKILPPPSRYDTILRNSNKQQSMLNTNNEQYESQYKETENLKTQYGTFEGPRRLPPQPDSIRDSTKHNRPLIGDSLHLRTMPTLPGPSPEGKKADWSEASKLELPEKYADFYCCHEKEEQTSKLELPRRYEEYRYFNEQGDREEYFDCLIRNEQKNDPRASEYEKYNGQEIYYCCASEDSDQNDIGNIQEVMKLPHPPPKQQQQQNLEESHDRYYDNRPRDVSFVMTRRGQRNVYREVEFLRERCSELIQKLKFFVQIMDGILSSSNIEDVNNILQVDAGKPPNRLLI